MTSHFVLSLSLAITLPSTSKLYLYQEFHGNLTLNANELFSGCALTKVWEKAIALNELRFCP
ncbi:MAG TPA: hypothetical protein V6C91_12535 [Coleofasciculaceae cyanobacterium]